MNKAALPGSFNDWVTLCKLNISLPVTLTTLTGFVLYAGALTNDVFFVCSGVLMLACASSALNHILERKTDALMARTCHRPVVSGRISVSDALVFVFLFAVIGSFLLLRTGILPLLLGLFNMFWYSAVYTRLKKITAFAVIPGSLVGAVPPVIGWVAAGGKIDNMQIILVSFFFFIGQIPHFWMLIMRYGKDYEAAGLPSLTSLLSTRQIANLTLVWVTAAAMAALMLVIFGIINSFWLSVIVFLLVVLLLFSFRNWFSSSTPPNPKPTFIYINLFYLAMMMVLIINRLI